MSQHRDNLATYYADIADHELLGREGEIALAKRIEDQESEVWRRILSFEPALPSVLKTLRERGIELPGFAPLPDLPSKALAKEIRESPDVATAIRERDRDRLHLAAVLTAIDAQEPKGRGRTKWRQGVASAIRAAAALRQRFVSANLRFVITISRNYVGRGVSKEDLIQEGNLGLIKAVDRFKYRQGYRFSTYAGWWIRHAIQRSLANASRTVRVPVHVQEAHRMTLQAHRDLAAKLGREATNHEVAEQCQTTVEHVRALQTGALRQAVSLDQPVREDGPLGVETLANPENDQRSPLETILRRHDVERVQELLATLPGIQADVLRKRFGLDGFFPMTLRSIGDEYGLSRERIRQIQGIGLKSLRSTLEKQDGSDSHELQRDRLGAS